MVSMETVAGFSPTLTAAEGGGAASGRFPALKVGTLTTLIVNVI